MPDLEISQLPQLAGTDVQGTDPVAVADLSASETKKLTIADLATFGIQFIADDSISGDKIISLDGSKLVADSVTAAQIAPNAIGSSELADDSVDTAAIQDAAVTNIKLANGIDGAKLLPLSVTDAAIVDIDGSKILVGTIPADALADGIISNAKLADGSVTTEKLADGAVTDAKIAVGINGSKIVAGSITNAQLATNSVGADQIISGSVGTDELATASVTDAKIVGVNGSKLTDASVTDAKIVGLDGSKLTGGSVGTSQLASNAVTNAKVATNAISTDNVVDSSITNDKLASGISGSKLAANSVGNTQLAADSVANENIQDDAVSDAKIVGPINGGKLTANSVTGTQLGDVSERGLSQSATGKIGIENSITAGSQAGISFNEQGLVTGASGTIPGADLAIATTDSIGAVSVPTDGGLAVTPQGALSIANDVAAATVRGIEYDKHGSIVSISENVPTSDLPLATISTVGVVKVPGPDIGVDADGAISLADSGVIAGVYPKVQVNNKGVVTAGSNLSANDIPDISADKITTGELDARTRILDRSITQIKLADNATAYIQETIPPATTEANYKGCMWFQESTGQLRIFSGNSWLPVGFGRLAQENLRWGGIVNAATGLIVTLTDAGQTAQLIVGAPLPEASDALGGIYLVTDPGGTSISVTAGVTYDGGDWVLCINELEGWTRINTMASGGGGGGSTTLGGLSDVQITNPANDQALVYDGLDGLWKNEDIAAAPVLSVFGRDGDVVALDGDYDLGQIGDVDLTTTEPIAGDILKFDGTNFVPVSISSEIPIQTLGAGAGLFDSGTNAKNPILNIGAVTDGGITVNVDDIQIDRSTTDTWYAAFGAQPNVQSNWTETDPASDAFIQNKPSIPPVAPVSSVFGRTGSVVAEEGDYDLDQLGDVDVSGATTGQLLRYNGTSWEPGSPGAVNVDLGYTVAADSGTVTNDSGTNATIPAASVSGAGLLTSANFTKLAGIETGAEANVQSNWNETDIASDAFIQNKPAIPVVPPAQDLQSVTDVGSHTTNTSSFGGADLANAGVVLFNDGSGIFKGSVDIGNSNIMLDGDDGGITTEGQIFSGQVNAKNYSSSNDDVVSVFAGIAKDGTQTFDVYANGNVETDGSVTAGGDLYAVNARLTGFCSTTVTSGSSTAVSVETGGAQTFKVFGEGTTYIGGTLPSAPSIKLEESGNITAGGTIESTSAAYGFKSSATSFPFTAESNLGNGGKSYFANHTGTGSSSSYLFYGQNSGGEVFSVATTGALTAKGRLNAGDSTLENRAVVGYSADTAGATITAIQYNENGPVWQGYSNTLSSSIATSTIFANGRMDLSDTLNLGGGYADATGGISAYSAGGLISGRASSENLNYVFQGYLNGTGVTTNIDASGNATFSGNIEAGGTIESTSGGFVFPDGSTQTTAATSGAAAGDGALTINLSNGSSATGTFTANQSGASTLTLPTIPYSIISGTPTIPTVGNGTITIKQGGTTKGTFTVNQTGPSEIDLDGGSGTPGDGSLTIASFGQEASATGSFSANQSGNSTITLPQIRYADLSGQPDIPSAANNGSLQIKSFGQNQNATGSFTANQSGTGTMNLPQIRYQDLSGQPTIPAAQVQTNWNASSGISSIANKPNLAVVATSGSYNDLSNKPTIPGPAPATNLGNSTTSVTVTISSSTGNDTTLNAATASKAGIMDVNHVNAISTANSNASQAISDASSASSAASSAQGTASAAQTTANNAMPKSGGNFTGNISFSEGKRIELSGGGLAGIVNTSSDLVLYGNNSNSTSCSVDAGGMTVVGQGIRYDVTNAWIGFTYVSGTVMNAKFNGGAWGNIAVTSSDVRLKENIESFEGALGKINTLKPRTFTWKDTEFYYNSTQRSAENLTRYGFIADEVIEVIPEAARVAEPTEETPDPIKDYDDRAIISLLVKSVQELSAEVADLKQQLAAKE